MTRKTISLYDAKARLSEIVRLVRERGDSFAITYHGKAVAEIRPLLEEPTGTLESRIAELEADGAIIRPTRRGAFPRPIRYVPGGLERFLEERD